MSRCKHDSVVAGRKPGTERCKDCSWVFPCRGNDCGHMECIEFRAELPVCHYCQKRVQGSPAGVRSPASTFAPIASFGGPDASWTPWSVRGVTRAVHYCCRDAVASPSEIRRWGEKTPCDHEFDGKGVVGQDDSEQAEEAQEAIA